ncbi:MAG: biotin/lipoyl-containing protein [Chthonomonadales bacterium]
MNFQEISSLVDLVVNSGISEMTLKNGDRKLTVRKGNSGAVSTEYYPSDSETTVEVEDSPVSAPEVQKSVTVTATMVGIFHYASPPVGVGTQVEVGMVIGIIESMKLMNEVQSETSGFIHKIEVEAGMAVEYGTPLFVVGPNSPSLNREANE